MTTKYNTVRQAIKSKIIEGTYTPHQKISSESELMKEFSVSRHTVRLAIGDLVTEGWLYKEQGSGTFCADRSKINNNQVVGNQKNIAIITTYISDYIFPSIIRGAESRLSEEGYQVSIFSTNNDQNNERRILEKILSQKFDGVIVEPTKSGYSNPNINYYLNLERLSIPYIMINAYYDELEPISIVMDDEKGGFLQTDHLIKLGHENLIGFFKTDDTQGTKRMKGFLKAHRKNKIAINPSNIITYNTEEKNTKPMDELKKVLAVKNNAITGLVCYNDELAMKLLDILRTDNIQVPEDISIVGYDDSFLAEVSEVKLTTIEHPKSEMGEAAANTILDLIQSKNNGKSEEDFNGNSTVYAPNLTIRKSTRDISESKVTS
ncbi:GntR family transcriptional regulator of arabinose operon [Virgibacillus natechei]|uniref:GntR family transcriptional regulator of arabinose operon n=1 Tax=Virgibacillus natechei TaxID=1216297 RepID=A0ABS4IEE5_9BACI|nr:GntR family transcriptional regulator [Virgibacillus natechei]MBP1969299.1 GntR family transcriptional regulator of arabinose operon [Virgibacillus natechei]UZD12453.1 GntR family transcriptional regulator [Virgibacillus natechei]